MAVVVEATAELTDPQVALLDEEIYERRRTHEDATSPTTLLQQTLSESEVMLSVRVGNGQSYKDSFPPYIHTRFVVSEVKVLFNTQGSLPLAINTIVVDGGEVDGEGVLAAHAPRLRPGSEYVILSQEKQISGGQLVATDERQALLRSGNNVLFRGATISIESMLMAIENGSQP